MTKDEAIAYFGGVNSLARALKIWPQPIYKWTVIPQGRQYEIEVKTQGKLKADREEKNNEST